MSAFAPIFSLAHCFFTCKLSVSSGTWILDLVMKHEPLSTREKLLRLEVDGGEAILWIMIVTLDFIWNRRSKGKCVKIQECIATILADAQLLRETNFANLGLEIENIIK